MNELDPILVKIISDFLKGNKLKFFTSCVDIINESLALGGWTLRGSVKSVKGFSQGLMSVYLEYTNFKTFNPETSEMDDTPESIFRDKLSNFCRSLGGCNRSGYELNEIDALYNALLEETDRNGKAFKVKFSVDVAKAWIALIAEVDEARMRLDKYRKLPVITEIGVSPRVTRTLDEMGMGAESYTVILAELERHEKWVKEEKIVFNRKTKKKEKTGIFFDKLIVWYTVKWSEGIKHRWSRFGELSCNCEACGKNIPSRRFVAMELHRNDGVKCSMWVGTDCASNLFGIKDVGVERPQEAK